MIRLGIAQEMQGLYAYAIDVEICTVEVCDTEHRRDPLEVPESRPRPTMRGSSPSQVPDSELRRTPTVSLPPSLLEKLEVVSRQTGLTVESLVWDAVDFYVEEKVFEWLGINARSSPRP